MALPVYFSLWERIWYYGFRLFCAAVFIFLILPILIILPLSFNVEPYSPSPRGCCPSIPARSRCAGTGTSS